MDKVVAIVGSHPLTRADAPYSSDKDIWVFNEAASLGWPQRYYICEKLGIDKHKTIDEIEKAIAKKITQDLRETYNNELYKRLSVFQLHKPQIFKNKANRNDKNHYAWLNQNTKAVVFMQDAYEDVPASVRYPLDEICAELLPNLKRGDKQIRYFSSSVDYAIALAIYRGYRRIEIYGVEMATNTEYVGQRMGLGLWAGIAISKGIEVVIPQRSVLFKGLLYAYEGDIVINRQEFESSLNRLTDAAEQAKEKMLRAGAMAEAYAGNISISETLEEKERWSKLYLEKLHEYHRAIMEYGVMEGARQENERYLKECDEMIAAIGGEKVLEMSEEVV